MRTYTKDFFKEQTFSVPEEIREKLETSLNSEGDNDEILRLVMETFRPFFPIEYILLSYSSPQKEQNRYYLYPPILEKRRDYRFITTKEQSVLFASQSPGVVHIGSEADYSISLGLIRQLFPNTRFSMLMFRIVNSRGTVCGLSFIVRKPDAYTPFHAQIVLGVSKVFNGFFEKKEPQMKKADIPFKRNTLSISKLPGLSAIYEHLASIARHDFPVLLLGETGTGKEIVADTLYRISARVYGPFIKVNCGSIPEELADSEFFGHEQGAFSGAIKTRKGCFEQASQGMLLLDEIGELSHSSQTRLLRVLQDGCIRRVGDFSPIDVDVRVIAATHRFLPQMVKDGTFREDLFYRLNVFPLYIPPLRERPEDIAPLLEYFITSYCTASGWQIPEVSRENMAAMLKYPWPGNVRELQNGVERALILWNGGTQGRRFHISLGEALLPVKRNEVPSFRGELPPHEQEKLVTLDEAVAQHILRALKKAKGRIHGVGGAADILGINPSTLRSRMKKLGIGQEKRSRMAE